MLVRLIRLAVAKNGHFRLVVLGAVALYLVAPFSIAYVWNDQNLGRLDVYMLLVALLALLAGLTIKNTYVKCVCYTLLGVVGLAIHQGFAFLYYPIVFSVMVYDVFEENRVHAGRFAAAFVSGLINVAVAVYFQFFSSIHFDSAKELVTFLEGRTNLTISEYALDIEYFLKMDYQLKEITPQFYKYDAPIRHALLVLLLLLPVLVWCFQIYRDVFGWQKKCNVKWYASPYFYMLLSQLCFVPMFVIHTDWGRHFAPLFAMQIFMFLFYAAKGEPAMVYACEKMCGRMKKHPWIFVVSILWIAKLDSFGARDFLKQATYLFDFLQRGFFIN